MQKQHAFGPIISALVGLSMPAAAATYITPAFPSTSGTASFLRFHNPTAAAGTVTVTLRLMGGSESIGTWTATIPAGAALQTALRDIESAAGVTPPAAGATYSLGLTATFNGFAQQVVWSAASGSLTNLSSCGPAVAADGAQVANVHTSLLPNYVSAVVLYNTGLAARAATLTIRDARSGQVLGTWTSPAVAAGAASRSFSATEILRDARIAVGDSLYHVNLALDAAFTGHLQHLSTDVAAARTTDMSAKCVLTAGGAS